MLHLLPPAKINLGLLIKGKRSDGYHLLESLLYPLPEWHDELWMKPEGEGCQLELIGRPIEGDPHDNLCVKAWRALREVVPSLPGVRIRLEKRIPAGAGLGGGSSDAAHVLKGLVQLFELPLSREQLVPIAAKLGADVPFFLFDGPQLASGTGTELRPFPLEASFRVVLRPQPIHSATVAAYQALDYRNCDPKRNLRDILSLPLSSWREQLVNDLEAPVFDLYPQLAKEKKALYDEGAIYAAMSGSGSAVFGLFPV